VRKIKTKTVGSEKKTVLWESPLNFNNSGYGYGKTWIAHLIGKNPKGGYVRVFKHVSFIFEHHSKTTWVKKEATLAEGIYEVHDENAFKSKRYFLEIRGGKERQISREEVESALANEQTISSSELRTIGEEAEEKEKAAQAATEGRASALRKANQLVLLTVEVPGWLADAKGLGGTTLLAKAVRETEKAILVRACMAEKVSDQASFEEAAREVWLPKSQIRTFGAFESAHDVEEGAQ
jgi:hypothetical protein